ncbi:ABC transporter permease [Trichocoleus sp. FACHB-262]|uniref:ABC transporter permease n=1 Tax=Trichocoleus sp. FACHB-262 TaxID=2692869 RepID=UPI001684EAFB|nr:ABC transporter permease [Trichocoleus sp. FACHB-262]MBD2123120.1 ABC transporter permease [Trichocoleus sp. FACHB-262]
MLNLFWAELRRSWIQFIRYPADAIAGIFIITLVFYGLFSSVRYIAGPTIQFGDRLDSAIVDYVLWTLLIFIMNDIAIGLQSEAQTGTLEQLFLSPFGAARVFLMRAIASLTLRLVLTLTILLIILAITGARPNFSFTMLLPLGTILLGAYGLAFALGALSLLLKRVQQLLGIFQFALLFLIATPTEKWTGSQQVLANILPMTTGAGVLRELMAEGQALDWNELAIAFINGAVYLVVGVLLFWQAERRAKQRGLLSGY